jgi:hypothetical protein
MQEAHKSGRNRLNEVVPEKNLEQPLRDATQGRLEVIESCQSAGTSEQRRDDWSRFFPIACTREEHALGRHCGSKTEVDDSASEAMKSYE